MLWKWVSEPKIIDPVEAITFLSHFDNNFNDSALGSTDSDSPTNHGVTFSSSEKKFGTHSAYFDGSSYLEWPNHSDYHLGNNFTISCWFKRDAGIETDYLFGAWPDALAEKIFALRIGYDATIDFLCKSASLGDIRIGPIDYPDDGGWHHIEVTYDGLHIRLFIDGIRRCSYSHTSGFNNGTARLTIGMVDWIDDAPYAWTVGYLDEIMIMNNYCLHTEDFTPPTEPW